MKLCHNPIKVLECFFLFKLLLVIEGRQRFVLEAVLCNSFQICDYKKTQYRLV